MEVKKNCTKTKKKKNKLKQRNILFYFNIKTFTKA